MIQLKTFLKTIGGSIAFCKLDDYPDNQTIYAYVDGHSNLTKLIQYLKSNSISYLFDEGDELEGSTYCVLVIL
jgi:hypothetical protein